MSVQSIPQVPPSVAAEVVEFWQEGYASYATEAPAAPAANTKVREALAGLPVGSERGMAVMRAFQSGHHAAAEAALAAIWAEVTF